MIIRLSHGKDMSVAKSTFAPAMVNRFTVENFHPAGMSLHLVDKSIKKKQLRLIQGSERLLVSLNVFF